MTRYGDEMKKVVGRNRDKQPNRDNSSQKENYITVLVFGKVLSLFLLCIIIAKSLSNAVQNIPLHFSVLSLESSSCRKYSTIFAISSTIYLNIMKISFQTVTNQLPRKLNKSSLTLHGLHHTSLERRSCSRR